MKISVLHPSRQRAAQADATIAEWLRQVSGLHAIEYILSIDTSDEQRSAYERVAQRHGIRLLVQPNLSQVEACNQAARTAAGDLLLLVSDDIGCPPAWDNALALIVGERFDAAVLVDDGLGARTMALPIVGRQFYQSRGYLLFPGYRHFFSGDDLAGAARHLGKLLDATHLHFPHRHYTTGQSAYDPTSRDADRSWRPGAHLLRKRAAGGFGLGARTLRQVALCARLELRYQWDELQIRLHRLPTSFPFGLLRAWVRRAARVWRESSFRLGRSFRRSRLARYVPLPDATGPSPLLGYSCYVRDPAASGDMAILTHRALPSHLVVLADCVLDRSRVRGQRGGAASPGRPFPEELVDATFERGALQRRTRGGVSPARLRGCPQRLLASTELIENPRADGEEPVTTFVIERREYRHLWHTLTEVFNAYVTIRLLAGTGPFQLLFLDGHPSGPLDSLWSDILRPSRLLRLYDYAGERIRFAKLILIPAGYESPLWRAGEFPPPSGGNFLSDFVAHVLAAYQIAERPDGDRVVTFIDRRDSPPTPQSDGIVSRQVADLDHTVELLQQMYPRHRVEVRSFESRPFRDQLQIVRGSDVFCGVHGAALAHALFLRPDAELVEFAPPAFRRNEVIRHLAELRAVRYTKYAAEPQQMPPHGKVVVRLTHSRV